MAVVLPTTTAPRAYRRWFVVHKWASLIGTAILLVLCLTGLPLIFHHEIDQALGYEIDPPILPEPISNVSLDRVVGAAKAAHPEKTVQYIGFDREQPAVARVVLGERIDTPFDATTSVDVDRRTGSILLEPKLNEGPVAFLVKLHTELFAGLPGKLFLGLFALLLLAAVVSGVVLYGPTMRKLRFGTVRRDRTQRILWFDLHNLIGITTLAWVLVVGSTGLVNTWADLLLKLWQFGQLSEMTGPYRSGPRPAELASLDKVIATATAAAPQMTPSLIAFPGTMFTSNTHFAVFMAGSRPITARILKPALIEGASGSLTDVRAMPWYVQTLFISQPLHFGDYGGLPLKLVWAVLDIATIIVLGSGIYLWAGHRREGAADLVTNGASPAHGAAAE